MLFLLSGCAAYTAETSTAKDGSTVTRVNGWSLFTEKGIQKADVKSLGTIEGYNSNPNVEAMRAMGQGIGQGIATGVKVVGKP